MPAWYPRSLARSLLLVAAACGGNGADDDGGNTLPEAPQLLLNPRPVLFGLIEAGQTAEIDVVMLNGGQDELEITDIALNDSTGAFTVALVTPVARTAASTEAVVATLTFNPQVKGVFESELVITSNAQNEPSALLNVFGPAGADPLSAAPDVLPFETTVHLVPDLGLAFVRFFNVGRRAAALAGYELDSAGGEFVFASGVAEPTVDEPIALSRGTFVIITLDYTATGGGPHLATFTLTHYDYDDITYPGGVRTVDPGDLVTTVVDITSEPQ